MTSDCQGMALVDDPTLERHFKGHAGSVNRFVFASPPRSSRRPACPPRPQPPRRVVSETRFLGALGSEATALCSNVLRPRAMPTPMYMTSLSSLHRVWSHRPINGQGRGRVTAGTLFSSSTVRLLLRHPRAPLTSPLSMHRPRAMDIDHILPCPLTMIDLATIAPNLPIHTPRKKKSERVEASRSRFLPSDDGNVGGG